jgi:hypothetical protein
MKTSNSWPGHLEIASLVYSIFCIDGDRFYPKTDATQQMLERRLEGCEPLLWRSSAAVQIHLGETNAHPGSGRQ